jgi:ribonuclease P/MRP protein subunit RPP40
MYGFNNILLSWFTNYLSCRKQRVVIDGEHSDWLPVLSGVPQGSILGPMLFLLYINDLPTQVSNGSQVFLYADDSKCTRCINNIRDCEQLQSDINSLDKWSKKWDMEFNVLKCKIVTISRKRNPLCYNYRLNDHTLERVSEILDLGVNITSSLCFNSHIDKIVSKANRMLGMIKRVTDQ